MHFITTLKTTGEVLDYRIDSSVPQYWTEETLKSLVSANTKISIDKINTVGFEKLPDIVDSIFPEKLTPHEHLFDFTTGTCSKNPNFERPIPERRWVLNDIISKLSLAEKTNFNTKDKASVITAINEFIQPRNEKDTQEILSFLVSSGDISQVSMDKILA